LTGGLGALVAVLTWPNRDAGGAGLDSSWHMALHLAAEDRLRFGSELIFTYGPLGFLFVPEPFLGGSSLAAALVAAGIHVTFCVLLVRCARRVFPLAIAIGVTYLAAQVGGGLDPSETMVFIAFLAGVEMLWQGRYHPATGRVIVALGAFAGLAALGKINTGVVVISIGMITSVFAHRPWWRGLGFFVLGAAGMALFGWLVTGQGTDDILPFVDHSIDIVLGYSAAMGARGEALIGHLFAAGICIAILAAVGTRVSEGWPASGRIGLALVGAALAFASWKTGFTRWHFAFFFATAVLALFPLMLDRRNATSSSWAFVALFLGYVTAVGGNPVDLLDPVPSIRDARDFVVRVADGEQRRDAVASYRSQLEGAYGLSPQALELLEGRTVHTDAIETGVMWAYPQLEWAPYPVFQAFTAYTAELDALNAATLADARGPEFLIREPIYAVDGRHPWWETPQAVLEVVCRYREVMVAGRWQIVERGASRCGEERPIGEVTLQAGGVATVPRAGEGNLVVARVHGLEPTLLDRLATFVLRGPEWNAIVNDTLTFRMVPAHAGGPLLMSVPPAVGYTPPHAFPEPVMTLSFARVDDPTATTGEITVEFFAIEVGSP
jgi:hypothetical protein